MSEVSVPVQHSVLQTLQNFLGLNILSHDCDNTNQCVGLLCGWFIYFRLVVEYTHHYFVKFNLICIKTMASMNILFSITICQTIIGAVFGAYRPTMDDVREWEEAFNALPTNGDLILSILSDDVVLCAGGLHECIPDKATYIPLVQIQEDLILADNGHQSTFDENNVHFGDGYFLIEDASEYCEDYKGCSVDVKVTYLMFYNDDGLIQRWFEMPHDYDLFYAWVAHAFDTTGQIQCPTAGTSNGNESSDSDSSSSSGDSSSD